MADLKIQGEVVVDASQAESALDRVGSKAESMAAGVGQSAGQAGKAVDGIGDKAETGAQKFTRAEARMRDSIRKSTLELQQFGKTASEKLEFKLADKGLDASKFQPYLAELRKVEAAHQAASGALDGMGMSAKATAAALRGVPAQFTDIVTALQGGQRPLTVLMQQGGQLKDMFGGVGAAARALGGYVLGLINPFTLAAAAVGAIALAYNQGSKEQDAFVKSIVTTGNISGVTAGQLGQYARAISSVAGTQSKAAETLAAFVAEGVRGGAMLEKYAQTAIEWEKATGQSVAKTAEQFASLQKDPLSSVLKLNEGTNFLTESVYKQIKALDEQGRSADASKVAMDALNTAMESRSKTIEQNLGYIESAWRGITSAAKKAWDAMLNVGRAETGASQLASLRETLDQRMQRGPINDMPSTRAAWEKGNEGLRKQIDLLAEQERMLRRGAEAESERNKQLAARIEFDKSGEQYLSKRVRMEREIAKATNEAAAAGVGQAELEQRIASIREKFAEKNTAGMKAQRAAAKLLAEDMAALAKMAGLSPDFYKEWDKLNDMFKRGKLDVEGLTKAQAELLKKQPVIAAETKAQADAQKQVNASIDAYRSALQAVAKEEATRVDGIAKSNADLREQIATMGLTNQQIRARTIELNSATIAEKEQQLARLQSGFTNTREQAALEEEIRLLKERNGLLSDQGVKEQYVAAQQEITDTWVSIDRTAHDTFVNIFEDGAGTFKRLGQTLKAALLDMLYQMTVKRWIINIGASFGATGGIFGEGQGGAGGLFSTASNAYGAAHLIGNWLGLTTGAASGTVAAANVVGAAGGDALGTLISLNGGWGTMGGGAGGLFSTASNANSLFSGASLISNWMGTGAGAGMGTLAYGNMIGAMGGDGLGAFMAANGGWGTSGAGALANSAGSAFGGAAAGIAAVAAPLIIGSIIERNARDRISGAAYATSGGNDPFVNTVAGSTSFDYLTGDLPDRAALLARLEELGAPMEAISDWNDRALLRLTESAAADNSEFGINWTSRVRDMRDTPDFYRGAGYAHPEELGWWNNKDNANLSTDPALIQASRDIALSIIGPLEGIGALIGDEAAYRATVGFANRGEGNGLWAGLNLQRDGQNVADWVNTDDFHSVGEAVRAMYSTALGTLDSFDLPGWADKQVTDARTALDALSGDKIGEQAAALYQQATGGISATFAAIEKMINLFPDFSEASQDAVYALGELTGGLDNLASAYGSYLSNFYSEEERRQLMFKELDSELDKLGIDTIPRTRAEFRELVSAQDLSTEAGREAFTVLMKLSGGFAEFVDAAESAADNARERIDSIFGQISKLWDEQISNWSKLSSEAKSVFDAAIKAAKDLRGQVADTRQWDARAASVWIDQALAGLRATGALPDSKELADAIAAARGGLDMSQYDTLADMERDQLILAGKLHEIGDSAEVQMSFAEQQVQLLEQQRDYWRQQIDLLNATGETITSIDQGIEYLADYVREQTAIKAAEEAEKEAAREAARRAYSGGYSPGGWGGGGWGGGGGQDLTSITRTINWDTGEYVYPDGSGGTLSPEELEHFRRILDGELDPTRIISDLYQVPRHADGGRYAGGLALVGERGPELINFASPGHIYTADQTRDMMRGGDNAELIAELRELRARLDKIERNTAVLPQTHDVIDRVTAGGNAMLTEAA